MAEPHRRADARRNRERLLRATRAAVEKGDAPSIEQIARAAGVGIGTVYRNFATRDDLVEAVFAVEREDLCRRARELSDSHPPIDALRLWMSAYADFLAAKRAMTTVLTPAPQASQDDEPLLAAIRSLLEPAEAQGVVRAVGAHDLAVAVRGLFLAANDRPQLDRLLDLVIHGMKP